jgi:hypothetical protein
MAMGAKNNMKKIAIQKYELKIFAAGFYYTCRKRNEPKKNLPPS